MNWYLLFVDVSCIFYLPPLDHHGKSYWADPNQEPWTTSHLELDSSRFKNVQLAQYKQQKCVRISPTGTCVWEIMIMDLFSNGGPVNVPTTAAFILMQSTVAKMYALLWWTQNYVSLIALCAFEIVWEIWIETDFASGPTSWTTYLYDNWVELDLSNRITVIAFKNL